MKIAFITPKHEKHLWVSQYVGGNKDHKMSLLYVLKSYTILLYYFKNLRFYVLHLGNASVGTMGNLMGINI